MKNLNINPNIKVNGTDVMEHREASEIYDAKRRELATITSSFTDKMRAHASWPKMESAIDALVTDLEGQTEPRWWIANKGMSIRTEIMQRAK